MKQPTIRALTLALGLCATPLAASASTVVQDGFDGAVGAPPDAARFDWGGEVTQNGTGQLDLQTWIATHSWVISKGASAPTATQPLVLQFRAYAYAETWDPGIYGDQQPRGLRVGTDANNVIEFYSLSRTSVGMRLRKDGVESTASYDLPSGVDSQHDYEISVTTTSATFTVDGVTAGTITTTIPTSQLNVYVSTDDGGFGNVPVSIDSLSLTLSGVEAADFQYFTNSIDGTITIERYVGAGGVVSIPGTIYGRLVTAIGPSAFYSCSSLTNVTIPDSVTSIGDTAFAYCVNMTTAIIGSGVTNIGYHVFFSSTSLGAINVDINNQSFSSIIGILFNKDHSRIILCPPRRAGDYTIPSTVTSVGNGAFDHCTSLTGVVVPNSVTNIEDGAFYSCTSLASVTLGNSVTNIGNLAFYNCTSLTSIMLPDSVASIYGSFSDCTSLSSVTFGNSITNIEGAFVRCSRLDNVTLPNSVTDIRHMAFAGCTRLANIVIPQGVTNLADGAFSDCRSLAALTLPDGLVSIGQYTFEYCTGLAALTIPNHVTTIGQNAFRECASLTTLAIPDSVTSMGWSAITGCGSLTTVTLGKNLVALEPWNFWRCGNLQAIVVDPLNPFFSSVDGVLFDKSGATLIEFPEGKGGKYMLPGAVTSLGNYSFQGCSNLTSVTIPGSVTNIGSQAFASCANLMSVYFQGNAPAIDSSVFNGVHFETVYYMPGTTGWGPLVGGCPAVLWNPQALTSDAAFGVLTNQFGFTITGSTGLVLVVEACTNLANPAWYPVSTNTLTDGSSYFGDATWANRPACAYRLRSP